MPIYDDLRYVRFDILLQIDAVTSSNDLLDVQEAIAEAIMCVESAGSQIPNEDKKRHIEKLRIYADGLVWKEIHPHAIRQLAKSVATPKSLLSQGNSFDVVRNSARRYVKSLGIPVLIADVTNVIRVGDIILATNSETPLIVEVKSHLPMPQHLMQGRRGRQISRNLAIHQYLRTGSGKLFGEDMRMKTLETPHRAQRNWHVVTDVCQEALRSGFSSIKLSDYETLWACPIDAVDSVIEDAKLQYNKESASIIGTSAGLMNMMDGDFAPPPAWPIPVGLQFALVEQDILLVHLLDTAALNGVKKDGNSIEIRMGEDYPVVVKSAEREYPLSLRFLYDVVYGYETLESAIAGIFDFARGIEGTFHFDEENQPVFEFSEASEGKPRLHDASSVEKAFAIAASRELSGEEFVALSSPVAQLLTLDPLQAGEGLWLDEEIPRYGVISVSTLRKLIATGSWS